MSTAHWKKVSKANSCFCSAVANTAMKWVCEGKMGATGGDERCGVDLAARVPSLQPSTRI